MCVLTFVQPDGDELVVEASAGDSIMRAAVENGVPGIVGECGGSLSCATCHVYVESSKRNFATVSEEEEDMLEWTADPRDECSRLSCQLVLQEQDAVVLRVPSTQY